MDELNRQRASQAQDPDDLLDISLGSPSQQPYAQSLNGRAPHPASAETTEAEMQSSSQPDRADRNRQPTSAPDPVPSRAAVPVPMGEPVEQPASSALVEEEVGENWFAVLLKETVETIVLALVIFLLIRVGIQNYRIEGSSMEPNFHHGEYLLVNKLAYRLGEYKRGDVIVFHYPGDPSKDYIKRVIGLPGDTVEIRDQILYVNGVPIDEPYETMPMSSFPSAPVVVEPGHLYVLGDNRPASSDTRDWGLLDEDLVIGKAWLAIYPLDQFGLVEHPELSVEPIMAQGP